MIFLLISVASIASAGPINLVQKAVENEFEKFDNYLPKVDDFPKYRYSTFGENQESNENLLDAIEFKSHIDENPITLMNENLLEQETTTIEAETTTTLDEITTFDNNQLDPVLLEDSGNGTNRTTRQEIETNDVEVTKNITNTAQAENQESSEEEEETNMVTGLISAFLGGLSRPDGSVDVEAITGLLGSLSTQNPDGTYDFSGLTELLMSFLGGGGEDGGGSDFGAFLGGIAGAFLKGVAVPPGAKGTGIFLGNLLTGILPALSAPAPTEEGQKPDEKPEPLDSGGFLSGFLSTIFRSSGNLSAGISAGSNTNGGGGGSKFSLFKAIFSIITSIFSSSSASH